MGTEWLNFVLTLRSKDWTNVINVLFDKLLLWVEHCDLFRPSFRLTVLEYVSFGVSARNSFVC